jgi:hypothetical protein
MLGTGVNVIVWISRRTDLDGRRKDDHGQDIPDGWVRTDLHCGNGGGLFTLHRDFAKRIAVL